MIKLASIFFLLLLCLPSYSGQKNCHEVLQGLATQNLLLLEVYKGQNYQDVIWELRSKGELSLAEKLEAEIRYRMGAGYLRVENAVGGSSVPRIYSFSYGLRGVGKKKPARPTSTSWIANVETELAAYEIDKIYGFDFTPLTFMRELDEVDASIQFFYHDAVPKMISKVWPTKSETTKLKIFDYLLNNFDRREPNYLVTPKGKIIAIDHGVSLHNARSFQGAVPPPIIEELDLSFFQTTEGKRILVRLRTVSDNELAGMLKKLTTEKELNALIGRKNALLRAIDGLQSPGLD